MPQSAGAWWRKTHDAEAIYHTLATLLSRWLLARSEYPEMEAIKTFSKDSGLCCPVGTFLVTVSLKYGLSSKRLVPSKADGHGSVDVTRVAKRGIRPRNGKRTLSSTTCGHR
jgi:hypothetical protein